MSDLLYHGTNRPLHILKEGILRRAIFGYKCVSLSRSYNVAAYFAAMEREPEEDDVLGGIFTFSRKALLAAGFETVDFHDPIIDCDGKNELEEQVWSDIPLSIDGFIRLDLLDRAQIEPHWRELIPRI